MPRLSARPLLWAIAVALAAAPAAVAQPKIESSGVGFKTADGVDLQGTLYKSAKGPASPCVILMHSLFKQPNEGDWDGLALMLAEKGFTVLRFDFRGHGKSTAVDPKEFWSNAVNQKYMPTLWRKNPQPIAIKTTDFETKTAYVPHLANDILAARMFLDRENDNGTANTTSVYLIGATNTATIGMIFLAAEWHRPQSFPPLTIDLPTVPLNIGREKPAGEDIAGAIWLSAGVHSSMTGTAVKALVSGPNGSPDLRDKNPMSFIHGELDKSAATGSAAARFFYNDVLVARGSNTGLKVPPLKLTEVVPIKDSKAVGVALLGGKLGTEAKIVDFLEKIEKDRRNLGRIANRGYKARVPLLTAEVYGAFR